MSFLGVAVVRQYERGVVFRLGRLRTAGRCRARPPPDPPEPGPGLRDHPCEEHPMSLEPAVVLHESARDKILEWAL